MGFEPTALEKGYAAVIRDGRQRTLVSGRETCLSGPCISNVIRNNIESDPCVIRQRLWDGVVLEWFVMQRSLRFFLLLVNMESMLNIYVVSEIHYVSPIVRVLSLSLSLLGPRDLPRLLVLRCHVASRVR